jgi:rare lipoprotein A
LKTLHLISFTVFFFFGCKSFSQQEVILQGKASYYAKKFEGRRTASGERFSNKNSTAAHKTLPFGTLVKVTNTKNDKCIIVMINDRLPKKSKRIIDLSQAAANELGFIREGTTTVHITILDN